MAYEDCYKCPFCNAVAPMIDSTYQWICLSFESLKARGSTKATMPNHDSFAYNFIFFKCPQCEKVSILADGAGSSVEGHMVSLSPQSCARPLPEYIPLAIRKDYEEACNIVTFSPKASATLSRRCLQGMIRDFWGINESKLNNAIQALKGKVPAAQWEAINALRCLGNIGAHMESDINMIVDIDPDEAEKLIKLIDLLLDKWYKARHDEEELLKSIKQINDDKQELRHS